jgi:hypothetical protein
VRVLVAFLLLIVAPAGACGRDEMPSIQDVKAEHASRIMALPGVVSVGIGRDAGGQPILVVGLDRERAETRARLPQELEGYVLKVEIVGDVRAQ